MAKEDGECTKNRTRLAHANVFFFSQNGYVGLKNKRIERKLRTVSNVAILGFFFLSAVGRQPCSPQLTVLLLPFLRLQIWTWSEKQGTGSKDGCHQYRSAQSNAHPCFPHGGFFLGGGRVVLGYS